MESSLWQGSSSVNIYVRSYNKIAIVMTVETPIFSKQLRQNIAARYRSTITEFALFHNGKRIDHNQTLIVLHKGSIIHIIDLQRTKLPEIKLTFKYQKNLNQPIKVKVSSRAYIRDILQSHIKTVIGKGETEVFLVYVGRPLNIFKRFEEELVESDSEIMIVQFKKKHPQEGQQATRECQIDHTRVQQIPSLKETVNNLAPVVGMRSISDIQSLKNSKHNIIAQKISPQMLEEASDILPKTINPFSKGKILENIFQQAAPGASSLFDGFNPNLQTAPGQKKPQIEDKKIINKGNIKEVQQMAAPGSLPLKGSPEFIAHDFIFSGEMNLEETENLLGGAVLEMKEDFLKKSKSQSSGHSKG